MVQLYFKMNNNKEYIKDINTGLDKTVVKKSKIKDNKVRVDISKKQKTIMITELCNCKCLMCLGSLEKRYNYSKDKIYDVIDKYIDGSEEVVQLSGGEPTIRHDLKSILLKIKEKNSDTTIQLNTNGRMFYYKSFLNNIKDYFDSILTEIHGPNCKIHDTITQSKGSFNQTINGIKNLTNVNKKVTIIILINKINYKYLPEISKLICREFNSTQVRVLFKYTWFVNNAKKNFDKLFIKVSEISPYLQRAIDIINKNVNIEQVIKHFPICIFDKKYHKLVSKETFVIDKRENKPNSNCEKCKLKEKCSGIWVNYPQKLKKSEFHPMK
ncbi:MAG: radical SAM protein [Candidatus Woesearchaeota archaeon]